MQSAVGVVKKFQNVAILATVGTVGYYYLVAEPAVGSENVKKVKETASKVDENVQKAAEGDSNTKRAHDLTGKEVDPDKQVSHLQRHPTLSNLGVCKALCKYFYRLFVFVDDFRIGFGCMGS